MTEVAPVVDASNRSCDPPLPSNKRTKVTNWWSAHPLWLHFWVSCIPRVECSSVLIVSQTTNSGAAPRLGCPPPPRRTQACCSTPTRLCSHHYCDYHIARSPVVLQCCLSISASNNAKSKPVGCHKSNHYSPLHQRPYVQSHSEGALCRWGWERWHFLFCGRLLQSVRYGDADCSRNVFVLYPNVPRRQR